MAFSFTNFLKGFGQGALGALPGVGGTLSALIPAVGSVAGAKVSSDAANKAAADQRAAAERAAAGVTAAGSAAQQGMKDASGKAIAGVHDASGKAIADVSAATGDANGVLSNIYSDVKGGIKPYQDAGRDAIGTLSALTAPGGEFSQKFTADNFKDLDPGFNFRIGEATKALDRSAAAKGGALSGGSLRAITRYSQDYGSGEFDKAFNRFETQKNDRFNQLSNVANFGQNANGQAITAGSQFGVPQATNLINNGRYAGDTTLSDATYAGNTGVSASGYIGNVGVDTAKAAGEFGTQGANAAASGYLGSAKAVNNGIGGVANAAQNLFLSSILNKKQKQPAAYSGPSYYDE